MVVKSMFVRTLRQGHQYFLLIGLVKWNFSKFMCDFSGYYVVEIVGGEINAESSTLDQLFIQSTVTTVI